MAKDKPQQGEVVAVGPGRHTDHGALIPTKLKTGMKVLYGKYSGTEIEVDGQSVLIVKEADILAVVR
jgi:chaperonin GroES